MTARNGVIEEGHYRRDQQSLVTLPEFAGRKGITMLMMMIRRREVMITAVITKTSMAIDENGNSISIFFFLEFLAIRIYQGY